VARRHRIGALPVARLQGQDISDFYYELEHSPQPASTRGFVQPPQNWRPLRPKTIKHVAGVLNAALDLAVAQGLMPNGNPARNERISPPRVRKRTYDLFDVAELDALVQGAAGYMRPLVIVLARYGLRPGEALALRWTDLGATDLTVSRSIRDLETTKTDAGFRTIPVAADDMAVLRAWRNEVGESVWLFPGADGRPIRLSTFGSAFTRLLHRLGLRHRRPYDCRHTAITMVIAYTRITDGLSIADVARWAGHSQQSTTLSTYTHLLPASRSLVEAMARAFDVERLRIRDAAVLGDATREPDL
jgi:integrase